MPNRGAASNGGGPFWLQSARLVTAVVEIGSFGQARQEYTRHDLETSH